MSDLLDPFDLVIQLCVDVEPQHSSNKPRGCDGNLPYLLFLFFLLCFSPNSLSVFLGSSLS